MHFKSAEHPVINSASVSELNLAQDDDIKDSYRLIVNSEYIVCNLHGNASKWFRFPIKPRLEKWTWIYRKPCMSERTCRKIVKIEAFIEFFQFPKLMKIVKLRNIIYLRTFFFPINKIGLISKPKSILINLEDFTRVGNLIFENSKYSRKTKIFN